MRAQIRKRDLQGVLTKLIEWSWDAEWIRVGLCGDKLVISVEPEDEANRSTIAMLLGATVVQSADRIDCDWLYFYRNDSEAD